MAYNDFGFDPASIRRATAAYRAPRPTWDRDWQKPDTPPAAPPAAAPGVGLAQPASAPAFAGGGTYASTGDALLDIIRNTTMGDALARARGMRASAQRSAGNDPSLAASAGLEGLLVGQGEAAQALNRGALGRLSEIDARRWQEYMLRERMRLEEEAAKRQAWAEFLSSIGGTLGRAGVSAFTGGVAA